VSVVESGSRALRIVATVMAEWGDDRAEASYRRGLS
jgi:hypothetical protein